ncbi:MAG TPA: Ig-like domain repeat protein [Candidatus Thermoplasmatota archaeon]|nr:Ig-like domain repeat protein [Candidatus Thermoplasmatota archaeon]
MNLVVLAPLALALVLLAAGCALASHASDARLSNVEGARSTPAGWFAGNPAALSHTFVVHNNASSTHGIVRVTISVPRIQGLPPLEITGAESDWAVTVWSQEFDGRNDTVQFTAPFGLRIAPGGHKNFTVGATTQREGGFAWSVFTRDDALDPEENAAAVRLPGTLVSGLDVSAPAVTILQPPPGASVNVDVLNVSGVVHDSPGVGVQGSGVVDARLRLESVSSGAVVAERNLTLAADGSWNVSINATFAQGEYRLRVNATDAVGNAALRTQAWTLDRARPSSRFTTPEWITGSEAVLAWSASGAGPSATFRLFEFQGEDPAPLAGLAWALWRNETLDAGNTSRFPTLAIDAFGRPHAAWSRPEGLRYARDDGAGWVASPVPVEGLARAPRLAVDAAGRPHLCHRTEEAAGGDPRLEYTQWNGTAWRTERVADEGARCDIRLSVDGAVTILFTNTSSGNLTVAVRGTAGWTLSTLDCCDLTGALAVAPDGTAHVAYRKGDLRHAVGNASGGWATAPVDATSGNASLAVDSHGRPHLVYRTPDGILRLARHNGTAWTLLTVERDTSASLRAAIAIDAQNRPHVAFREVVSGDPDAAHTGLLRYATTRADGTFSVGDVEDGAFANLTLAIDGHGRPRILVVRDAGSQGGRVQALEPHATSQTSLRLIDLRHGDDRRFRVIATDAAGNEEIKSGPFDPAKGDLRLRVDQAAPTIERVTLSPLSVRPGATVRLSLAAGDSGAGLASLALRIVRVGALDRVMLQTPVAVAADGSASHAWNTTGVPEGEYAFELVAHDLAGNRNATVVPSRVDVDASVTTAVALDPLYAGGLRALAPGRAVLLRVEAFDRNGIASVVANASALDRSAVALALRDDGADDVQAGDGVYSARVVAGHVPDGAYLLPVRVTDGMGNERTVRVRVVVATTPPSLVALGPFGTAGSPFVIELAASSPAGIDVASFSVRLDGEEAGESFAVRVDGPNVTFRSEPIAQAERIQVRAQVADVAGNVAYRNWSFFADGQGPDLSVSLRGEAGRAPWWRSAVAIDVEAHDVSAPVSVEVRVGEGPFRPYEESVLLESEGRHRLVAVATDGWGNENATTVEIHVDRSPPRVLSVRREGAEIVADLSDALSGVVAARGVALVEGREVEFAFRPARGVYVADASALPASFSGTIVVLDAAGNEARQEFAIGGFSLPGLEALAAAGALAIAVRRRWSA